MSNQDGEPPASVATRSWLVQGERETVQSIMIDIRKREKGFFPLLTHEHPIPVSPPLSLIGEALTRRFSMAQRLVDFL